MTRPFALLVVGAAVLVATVVIHAQQPTFRAEVSLVTLDVIPRDSGGRFLSTLKPEDFEVFEDGVSQSIASVVLVHGGRVYNVRALPAPPTQAQEGIILPNRARAADVAGRIFLIFIDDLHLDVLDTHHVRALLTKIAATLIHEGDQFAIVSTGPSSIEEPLAYDRGRLEAVIGKVKGNGLSVEELFQTPEGALGPPEVRRRAHQAFSTAYNVIKGFEQYRDRRKALILISNGYDFDPFPEARLGKDKVFGGRYGTPLVDDERGERFLGLELQHNRFADTDLAAELRGLTNAANRANVSVYTIDPRGLVGTTDAGRQLDQDEWKTHLLKTQSTLKFMAEATGGLAVVNNNDLTAGLKRIDAETSDYYMLAYYSSNPDATKRTRALDVKVKQPDVKVWSRSTYTLKPSVTSR
jgi:VWFA-related protein